MLLLALIFFIIGRANRAAGRQSTPGNPFNTLFGTPTTSMVAGDPAHPTGVTAAALRALVLAGDAHTTTTAVAPQLQAASRLASQLLDLELEMLLAAPDVAKLFRAQLQLLGPLNVVPRKITAAGDTGRHTVASLLSKIGVCWCTL
jgi:hypothetical protein